MANKFTYQVLRDTNTDAVIKLTAKDAANNRTSVSTQVIVYNSSVPGGGGTTGDITPPNVNVTSPQNGSSYILGTTITLTASATDNVGVKSVGYKLDGLLSYQSSVAPYSCNWILNNIVPSPPPNIDVYVQMTVPNEFQRAGKINIGVTAGIESTICPKDWIDGCNRMDLIIGTSEHSKNVFLRTVFQERRQDTNQVINEFKITKPIEVLFEGAEYQKTEGLEILDNIKEDFVFKMKTLCKSHLKNNINKKSTTMKYFSCDINLFVKWFGSQFVIRLICGFLL